MAFTEILTSASITVEQFSEMVFQEYTKILKWRRFMGTAPTSVINTVEDLTKKPGDAITVQLMGQLQGGVVRGNNTGLGNEGRVDFFGQRITIDNVRVLARIDDVSMSQQRTNFDVIEKVKMALALRDEEVLDEDITAALSNVTTGRVRGRYLYGAADSNWNATHATALTNVDNTTDQLTTAMIDMAKRKAILIGNATAKIRPTRVKNGEESEEWFKFVGHTLAIRDLVTNDAAWKNAQINIPPQSNANSPIYSGTSFKGAWNGTLIYEYEEIQLIASTIQVAHNLFMGAQAGAVVWGQRSKFGEEPQDLGHRLSMEDHQIRGVSKLVFDRATPEDQGIVHVFSAAVAD